MNCILSAVLTCSAMYEQVQRVFDADITRPRTAQRSMPHRLSLTQTGSSVGSQLKIPLSSDLVWWRGKPRGATGEVPLMPTVSQTLRCNKCSCTRDRKVATNGTCTEIMIQAERASRTTLRSDRFAGVGSAHGTDDAVPILVTGSEMVITADVFGYALGRTSHSAPASTAVPLFGRPQSRQTYRMPL